MKLRTCLVTGAVVIVVLCAACDRQPQGGAQAAFNPSTIPLFSPNSAYVALLWDVVSDREAAYVRWYSADKPEAYQQLELASVKLARQRAYLSRRYHMVFSPDSIRLAITGPSDITLIDMTTGEHWKMETPGQPITSLVWLDKDRVCYTVDAGKRLVCSQGIKEALSQRKVLCEGPGISGDQREMLEIGDGWPLEHWSANKRYAVLASDRGAHLLDLDKGSMHPFGQLPFIGVTWSPDGRRAFYLGGESPRYEALIIMPDENRTADISSEFNSDFGNDFFSETDFYRAGETVPTSRWTVNGEWLVLNVHRRGAFLLRPEPWRVFPVGPNVQAWLEKQSPAAFGLPAHFSLTGEGYDPQVEPLPLPGVLLCYLPKIGRNCVIDYRGNVGTFLDEIRPDYAGSLAGPTISPDGRLAATAVVPGKLIIQQVNRPSSQPASSTSPGR